MLRPELAKEWQRIVKAMVKNDDCPYCSGRRVLPGFNDIATINPQLAKEWNPVLNESLTPNMFTNGSGVKVWWKCKKGHEWKARIADRTAGSGCPICAKEKDSNGTI